LINQSESELILKTLKTLKLQIIKKLTNLKIKLMMKKSTKFNLWKLKAKNKYIQKINQKDLLKNN
jgi:hypothetical protein